MSKDAMQQALEALEGAERYINWLEMIVYSADDTGTHKNRLKVQQAITAMQKALANEALDKKAENARELGLDYKPAQHKPVAWTLLLVGEHNGLVGKAGEKFIGHPEHYERVDVYTSPPAQRTWVGLTDDEQRLQMITEQLILVRDNLFRGMSKSIQKLQARSINEVLELENFTQSPQRTWVGLTDEELSEIYNQADWDTVNGWEYEQAIEAALRSKNT